MANSRPRLLDLFCGAGGAAMGYFRAGFDVVGVDVKPQPNYPFEFHQHDTFRVLAGIVDGHFPHVFDAIHASPPCQAYSRATPDKSGHPDLVGATRERLEATGLPWVMENVPGAPMRPDVTLCGSMFGLRVRRHRLFESNVLLLQPQCRHKSQGTPLGVYGHGGGQRSERWTGERAKASQYAKLMGMPWATPSEIVLAVPPAYTEFIGQQLLTFMSSGVPQVAGTGA